MDGLRVSSCADTMRPLLRAPWLRSATARCASSHRRPAARRMRSSCRCRSSAARGTCTSPPRSQCAPTPPGAQMSRLPSRAPARLPRSACGGRGGHLCLLGCLHVHDRLGKLPTLPPPPRLRRGDRHAPPRSGSAVMRQEGLALPKAENGTGSLDLLAGVGYLPAVQVRRVRACLMAETPATPVPRRPPWGRAGGTRRAEGLGRRCQPSSHVCLCGSK